MTRKRPVVLDIEDQALPTGRRLEAIERLVELSARLFNCSSAILLFNQSGVSRVVCGHGQRDGAAHMSYRWDYKDAPYGPDERFVVADALDNQFLQTRSPFARGPIGFVIRTPVTVADGHTLTLIVYDANAKTEPQPPELRLLDEIEQLIREEICDLAPLFADPNAHVSVALTLEALIARLEALSMPAAIFDRAKTIVAANGALERVLGKPLAGLKGLPASKISPRLAETFALFFERAFVDKISSPPIEYTAEHEDGRAPTTYSIVATPLSPLGTDDYFLFVTATDITERVAREDTIDDGIPARVGAPALQPEPCAVFLSETLVKRRAIRTRNGMSYITARAWRRPLKSYQISALKALKRKIPASFADEIAREIAESVRSLVGASAFKAVVPVPCGHSPGEECLSVAIARSLASQFGLPMIKALDSPRRKGSSHPKANVTRPSMVLIADVAGPALLIDDVATSGAHLEEAVALLRPQCQSVLPVAWICGDAS